jgi:predicted DNA-binding transcriptional regulator YafY
MSAARPSLVRLLKIHQAISCGGYPSLASLADLCEVNPRTIKRDLRLLREEFEAPIGYSRERQGYYHEREFSLAPAPFHERELLALSIAIEVANTFRNTPFAEAVRQALEKLRLMMPTPNRFAYDDLSAAVTYIAEPAPPERLETVILFNDLLEAVNAHRQVRLTYYTMSRRAKAERVVDPYQLYLHRGMWYLHGLCHLRHEARDFAVNRILHLEKLATTFAPPDPEAIRRRLARRFTIVQDKLITAEIWFDAETAPRIKERVWHSSQEIADHTDASCTLTLRVEGLSSVLRWVLSFGRHAVPLAPPELVTQFRAEAQAMAKSPGTAKKARSRK